MVQLSFSGVIVNQITVRSHPKRFIKRRFQLCDVQVVDTHLTMPSLWYIDKKEYSGLLTAVIGQALNDSMHH